LNLEQQAAPRALVAPLLVGGLLVSAPLLSNKGERAARRTSMGDRDGDAERQATCSRAISW
jgi:hypothetical protein